MHLALKWPYVHTARLHTDVQQIVSLASCVLKIIPINHDQLRGLT